MIENSLLAYFQASEFQVFEDAKDKKKKLLLAKPNHTLKSLKRLKGLRFTGFLGLNDFYVKHALAQI